MSYIILKYILKLNNLGAILVQESSDEPMQQNFNAEIDFSYSRIQKSTNMTAIKYKRKQIHKCAEIRR